jgi:hypothetical protein
MSDSRILVASRRPDQLAALEFEGYDVADVTTTVQVENACAERACAEHYDVLVMDRWWTEPAPVACVKRFGPNRHSE